MKTLQIHPSVNGYQAILVEQPGPFEAFLLRQSGTEPTLAIWGSWDIPYSPDADLTGILLDLQMKTGASRLDFGAGSNMPILGP